jgi:hypothetical protein
MNISLEVLTIDFDGQLVDADKLHAALTTRTRSTAFGQRARRLKLSGMTSGTWSSW